MSSQGSSSNATSSFPFLYLPAEIRFMIYKSLFGRQEENRIDVFNESRPTSERSSQILRVCRQCHVEAAPILYSIIRFSLTNCPDDLTEYPPAILTTIGARNCNLIKVMDIHSSPLPDYLSYCRCAKNPVFGGVHTLIICTPLWELDEIEGYNVTRDQVMAWMLDSWKHFARLRHFPFPQLTRLLEFNGQRCARAKYRFVDKDTKPDAGEDEIDIDAEFRRLLEMGLLPFKGIS